MSWTDILASALMIGGSLLALCAAIGLLRFPDVLTRLHAATKPQTLGMLMVFGGLAIRLDDVSATTFLLLVAAFQLLTAPVSAHMVSRSALRVGGHVDRSKLTHDDLAGERD